MTYRFGPFLADRTTYRVLKGERALDLTPKLLDLLFYLVERPEALVTKEALLDGVWPGANVTDNALAQAVSELRDALGDEPSSPTYIRTVARRGYRFIAPVETAVESRATSSAGHAEESSVSGDRRSVAVLDFANVSGDAEVDWLASGIAETVTSDLAALDRFRVIDRWRVVQAARHTNPTLSDMGGALGATLIVTGSYQRSGPNLRITARVVDLVTGEAVADAKVDGLLKDVFSLQDGIVEAFARELGLPVGQTAGALGLRETSSLDAYRAYTEGWLKIESLDTDVIGASIQDFERAIAIDPRYGIAYAGLANAEFVAFEMTRLAREPNTAALKSGIEHARHAIHLDESLAEAHATLSFVLSSAVAFDEARTAAQRAVSLEPESWRHQYRLGHASWGSARLRAFERAFALYPQFAYARFEMAMVLVARGRLDEAEDVVRHGVVGQDRQGRSGDRFPAIGFHWLLGALRASRGDQSGALEAFGRELAQHDRRRLYGPEYAAVALVSRGHAELALDRGEEAVKSFTAALDHLAGFARAHVGLSAAWAHLGQPAEAKSAREQAGQAIAHLDRTGRGHEAIIIGACDAALNQGREAALALLDRLLESAPPSYMGWTIPLEPLLKPLHGHPGFTRALARLAERAK
jgi:DNA-binding winged helix-turn-helix (wHTH) protein